MRASGLGMPTLRNRSTARSFASAFDTFSWVRMASTIWLPTRYTGLSEVMGSWKIIAMSLPRSSRYCFSDRVARSLPSNSREPPATCPGSAKRPMMERLVTDLPEPDSPTIARISP